MALVGFFRGEATSWLPVECFWLGVSSGEGREYKNGQRAFLTMSRMRGRRLALRSWRTTPISGILLFASDRWLS